MKPLLVHLSKDELDRENAARAFSRKCAARCRRKRECVHGNLEKQTRQSSSLAAVEIAKQRILAYKKQQRPASPRNERAQLSWYNQTVAKRLVAQRKTIALRNFRVQSATTRKKEAQLETLRKQREELLRGNFVRGSYILRSPQNKHKYEWTPSDAWRPAGAISCRGSGRPPPPLPSAAFRFAARAFLRMKTIFPFKTREKMSPRWRLAASGIRKEVLSDEAFQEKRRREFREEVTKTRKRLAGMDVNRG